MQQNELDQSVAEENPPDNRPDEQAPIAQPVVIGGAIIGLLVALAGVAQPRIESGVLPSSVVATVNGQSVHTDTFERALAMVASDRGPNAAPLAPKQILDRLIDEELLVQRALELGLPRSDASVRRVAVRAVIDSVVLEAESAEVGDAVLRDYFEEHKGRFTTPAAVHLERVVVRDRGGDDDPTARAAAAAKLLRAGASVDYIRAQHGDTAIAPLPAGPLLLTELAEHLGPGLSREVAESAAGEVLGPTESGGLLVVLRVRDREGGAVAGFEANRELVAAAQRHERVNQAMRDYLERLRARSRILLNESALEEGEER